MFIKNYFVSLRPQPGFVEGTDEEIFEVLGTKYEGQWDPIDPEEAAEISDRLERAGILTAVTWADGVAEDAAATSAIGVRDDPDPYHF